MLGDGCLHDRFNLDNIVSCVYNIIYAEDPMRHCRSQGLMRLAMSAFDYSDTSAHGAFNVFRVETLLKVPCTRHIWSSDPAISIMT